MTDSRARFPLPVMLLALSNAFLACNDDGGRGAAKTYTIGGTIAGLTQSGLVLASPGHPDLPVAEGQSAFTFVDEVASGTSYSVTVKAQPSPLLCTIADGSGVVGDVDVTGVTVSCGPVGEPGSWRSVPALPGGSLAELSATALPGGDVLVAGGSHLAATTWEVRAASYRFEVATESWKPVDSMNEARSWMAAVALDSGEVLVSGGVGAQVGDQPALASAEKFNPVSETWSITGAMQHARVYHSATLLPSGEVLVVGGYPGTYWGASTVLPLANAELYNPVSGEWSETGSLQVARGFHAAALLPSGKVLVVGGTTDGHAATGTASVEVYDPADGNWHSGESLQVPVQRPTATSLGSGEVLVAGGCRVDLACGDEMRAAWLYGLDGAWNPARGMGLPRDGHVAVLLSTGRVLVAGGDQGTVGGLPASVYDPEADAWVTTGPMQAWHGYSGAGASLPDGKALFTGGARDFGGASAADVVEVYEPGR